MNDNGEAGFGDSTLPLAVVIARTRWTEPPRIRHDITYQLMRWFNVLFCEFFPGAGLGGGEDNLKRVNSRLLVFTPRSSDDPAIRLYANIPTVHRATNRRYRDRIVDAVRSQTSPAIILVNFVYDFPEIMESSVFAHKTYVCYDEWPGMWRAAKRPNALKFFYQSKLFQRYENDVAQKADLCVTPHYPLRKKLRKINNNVEMVFHAHDDDITIPRIHRKNGTNCTIRVGFAGYIHYRLLDDWLLAVAKQKDMTLHLIGPAVNHDLASLTKYPTVEHIPLLRGQQLYNKLSGMDVNVIPLNPSIPEVQVITTNSKTFQYVATCRPIVMSDLPHYMTFPQGVIYKAVDARDFIQKIRKAYEEDCESLIKLRAGIASNNTWKKRGDMLYSLLKQKNAGVIR